jgi:hypothetical protein
VTSYTYDPSTHTYRTKRGCVAAAVILALRNAIADATRDEAASLTTAYLTGKTSIEGWADGFATLIRDAIVAAYLLGRGGSNAATRADDAIIAPVMHEQMNAARGFTAVLAAADKPTLDDNGDPIDPANLSVDENGDVVDENGDPVTVNGEPLTEDGFNALGASWSAMTGLLARAGSYESAAIAGYSAGQSAAWGTDGVDGLDTPPLHPGCRCDGSFSTDADGQVLFSWITADDERVCPECEGMEAQYSDYPTGVYSGDGSAPSDEGE